MVFDFDKFNETFTFNNDSNSGYFVWCNEPKVVIRKLHFCSWNLVTGKAMFEVGFLVELPDGFPRCDYNRRIVFHFYFPWMSSGRWHDVYPALKKAENLKFIFNRKIGPIESLDAGGGDSGVKVTFDNGEDVFFLPIKCRQEEQRFEVKMEIPAKAKDLCYGRFLMEFNDGNPVAHNLKDITSYTDTYDIQINEWRRTPVVKPPSYFSTRFCPVVQAFCLHILPRRERISFVGNDVFKNARLLEDREFGIYMNDIFPHKRIIVPEAHFVVFNKTSKKGGMHSFFTVVAGEIFGLKQVAFALLLNVVCTCGFEWLDSVSLDKANLTLIKFFAFVLSVILFALLFCWSCLSKKWARLWAKRGDEK